MRKLSFVGQQNVQSEFERLMEEGRIVPIRFRVTITTLCGEEVVGTIISTQITKVGVEVRTNVGLRLVGYYNMSMLTHDFRGNRSFPRQNREAETCVFA